VPAPRSALPITPPPNCAQQIPSETAARPTPWKRPGATTDSSCS
jgi:hypothetical protein